MIKIPVNSDIMNFLNEKYGKWRFRNDQNVSQVLWIRL